jgi:hypothetical protein
MIRLTLLYCLAACAFAQETLTYSINWPSGLSLGEATLKSVPSARGWDFTFLIEASVPGFAVRDSYKSAASNGYCSVTFEKEFQHGSRKSGEKSSFDKGKIKRETSRGGSSELKTGECARDALAFVFFLRNELQHGRIPGPQTIYFGSAYQLKLQFSGTQPVTIGEARVETDRISAVLKGPASETSFEVFFEKDNLRTPVLVRVPLPVGILAMELVRQ